MTDETKIVALLNKIAEEKTLQNYVVKLAPLSSGGANYTADLFVATITSKNKDDLHLFIKVGTMGEKIREASSINIYGAEHFIYTDLKTAFRTMEDKYGVAERDRLGMAEYYGASTVYLEEMIVIENLLSRGFIVHDRLKSVGWEYASSATREAAKLHALSMAYDHYYPDQFAETVTFLNNNWNIEENGEVFWNTFKIYTQTALNVVREENREYLQNFFNNYDLAKWNASYEPIKCQALIHGDFRTSNMLHRIRDDGSLEVIPVDYQTVRAGSPVIDLLYFIFTGTDAEFRKNYYEELIEHYYSELRASLTRLGLNPDEKYSKNDFEFELKEKLHFGLAIAVFTLPFVTVEVENVPNVDAEMELSDFAIQKTGSLYPERLNGVVDDFVRWGVITDFITRKSTIKTKLPASS